MSYINIIKEHWFLISSVVIFIIAIITMIIFSNYKLNPPGTYKSKYNNVQNTGFITDIIIGNTSNITGYCPNGYSSIPIRNNDGKLYNSIYPDKSTVTNICILKSNDDISTSDSIVTDVDVIPMSSNDPTGDRWISYTNNRCGDKSKQLYLVQSSSLMSNISGELCDTLKTTPPYSCNTSHNCSPTGLCLKKDLYSNIKSKGGSYLSDIEIRTDTDSCPAGWTKSDSYINIGCDFIPESDNFPAMKKQNLILCKKYKKI